MYTVSIAEVPPEPSESVHGFVVGIESNASVSLNPNVVDGAYTTGQVKRHKGEGPYSTPFNEGTLVGSTHDRTMIYVGLEEGLSRRSEDDVKKLHETRAKAVHITHELLGLLGLSITDSHTVRGNGPKSDLV